MPVIPSPYAAEFPQATYAILDTAFTYRINATPLGFGWGTLKSSAAYFYYGLGDSLRYYGTRGSRHRISRCYAWDSYCRLKPPVGHQTTVCRLQLPARFVEELDQQLR